VDWFHVVQLFTTAVDEVRKAENKVVKLPDGARWAVLVDRPGEPHDAGRVFNTVGFEVVVYCRLLVAPSGHIAGWCFKLPVDVRAWVGHPACHDGKRVFERADLVRVFNALFLNGY
jgi:hypothetical protein